MPPIVLPPSLCSMGELIGNPDETESVSLELAEVAKSLSSSFGRLASSFRRSLGSTSASDVVENEHALQWDELYRLPTVKRLRSSLFDENDESKADAPGKRVVDVTKLGALERRKFVKKIIKHIEYDNLRLLQNVRNRIDKVGVRSPRVEVRYSNLRVEAECEVVHGKPLPTLWNSLKSIVLDCCLLPGLKSQEAKITIIDDVNGIIKPGRMTLLLGPPGCGKTTLLKTLSGNLDKSLKVTGEVSYNGYKLKEFIPQKTSAYISQNDLHIPEMTVRETHDFSARCQGVGSRAETMVEVSIREKHAGVFPDADIDTYMKAISIEGQKTTLQTDYILEILGLDICEMIIGPTKALFMEEISNGLNSSTSYQIVACLQQEAHIADCTILVALLQPGPETFDLFDDIILMAEGKIIYHGPQSHLVIGAAFTTTMFLRTQMGFDVIHANSYVGALFFSLMIIALDGFPEAPMTVARLAVFYKQRKLAFLSSLVIRNTCHNSQDSMPTWLKWGFWVSPTTYGEIGLVVNEFRAPRWQETLAGNTTIGKETLQTRGLDFGGYFFWISVGALLGFAILFNIGFTLALTFLNSPRSRAIISKEKLSEIQGTEDASNGFDKEAKSKSYQKSTSKPHKDRLVLPFEPLTLVFQDVQYYVETPLAMREKGFTQKKLQLLCDITGALRPGVLTALMGVSGAGKTTLLDVLAGRKTSGTVEGDIRIGGHPKVQDTFARISGYCEQSDIHSPQVTVGESIIFSAWLRLHPEIDPTTKFEFVRQVLEIIELDEIRDSLVGLPGVSGLSTEQRKRLTIAVELVANPSIIFMDEPTTGLDARAAAIVMRVVKNVANMGRTIVCTIHQPSIDLFETFEEDISGVAKIRNNYNPATWMLEVTSTTVEAELGLDFAQVYKNSVLYQLEFCDPLLTKWLGTVQILPLETTFVLLEKSFIQLDALCVLAHRIFALWGSILGSRDENHFQVFKYACLILQVVIEVPYLLAQAIVFAIITYPMVGYYWSTFKVLWYFFAIFCTLLYFSYLGMLIGAMTPSLPVASMLQSLFYMIFYLFTGLLIPKPASQVVKISIISLFSLSGDDEHGKKKGKSGNFLGVANSKLVGLDALSDSYVLDLNGYAYFTVWRFR
ncbi:hypothetical protein RHSIM_Rhsim11G0101100 [Rhododendron simsii]|uniref:ABC transporter domain-containing protein n=1 Tax=Rhododendron simsii TaxID=118357 RepID=A0A834G7Y8_RHOSS|nr:hypothetical protein RHSIM_Rhsim11G0101100 [Rhododendron simsii]